MESEWGVGRVMKKAGTLVVALTVMSACGGSAALSKADYIKQADALCAAFSRKLTKGTSAATATLAISPNMDALWKGELKQLRALKAPKDDRARVATIWNEAEQAFSKWSAEVK